MVRCKEKVGIVSLIAALIVFASLASALPAGAIAKPKKNAETLNFTVFLNDREIGTHRVTVEHLEKRIKVDVEANFVVKILSIPLYRYYHKASELWQDSCLLQIDTLTKTNEEEVSVTSDRKDSGLLIRSSAGDQLISGCVRSYAYWDPKLLATDKLLNSQTGEYQAAQRYDLGEVIYEANGIKQLARLYRLIVSDKKIDLWYSQDAQWLALETTVKGGRNLAYRRQT